MSEYELYRVIGPPGCGKTTYLTRQVRRAWESGKDVMLCSLTRTAAAEMAGRDLPIVREAIGTLHAHAYRSLSGGFTGIADTPKYLAEWNKDNPARFHLSGAAARDMEEDNAAPLDDPDSKEQNTGESQGDPLYAYMHRQRARMAPEHKWESQFARQFYQRWTEWKKANDLLDFTDLLEIALNDVPHAPGNPNVIFADERQDLSALEAALLYRWGSEAGLVIETGDPWQCLYEWRGSDPDVFYAGDAASERILSQSYRVSAAVHRGALKWISRMPQFSPIEYFPTSEEGAMGRLEGNIRSPESVLPAIEYALKHDQTVMYLASCSYMLDPMIKLLRKEGIPFHNPYRVKNGKWNPLATRRRSLSSSQRLGSFLRMGDEGIWAREDLREWLSTVKCSEVLPSKQSYRAFEKVIANMPETESGVDYGILSTLVGEPAIEASMTTDVDWFAQHLVSERRKAMEFPAAIAKRGGRPALYEQPKVTVGTIHSVKGGEADVVILAPDVSMKGQSTWRSGPRGRRSMYRLFYVAMTRARQELYIMDPVNVRLAAPILQKGDCNYRRI